MRFAARTLFLLSQKKSAAAAAAEDSKTEAEKAEAKARKEKRAQERKVVACCCSLFVRVLVACERCSIVPSACDCVVFGISDRLLRGCVGVERCLRRFGNHAGASRGAAETRRSTREEAGRATQARTALARSGLLLFECCLCCSFRAGCGCCDLTVLTY